MRTGRIVVVVVGALLALVGFGALTGGVALVTVRLDSGGTDPGSVPVPPAPPPDRTGEPVGTGPGAAAG